MADSKISDLPVAATLTGAELVPVVQNGISARSTATAVAALVNAAYIPPGVGAVTTTVAAKLAQIVSVFDFMTAAQQNNCSSNLATIDVTAAINSAVAYLNGLGGGRLYYPPGSYLVGTTVTVSYVFGNISHEGASRESTVIVNASSNSPAFTIGNNATQIYGGGIAKMRFTGKAGVVGVTGQAAFLFQKVGQFRVADVLVANTISALYRGAHFLNCSQYVLCNLQVQSCLLDGITEISGIDIYATDCRSDANGAAGFVLNTSQGGLFKSCIAFNNTGVGWGLISTTPATAQNKNNQFLQCVGDTSGSYNWQIQDSQDSQWLGCWGGTQQSIAVNTFATGFFISTQYSTRLGFTGCIAINNNLVGFQVSDPGAAAPTYISFDNCQAVNNGQSSGGGWGFAFNGVTNRIRWNGGVFSGNVTAPILNQSSAADNVISANPAGFVATNQGAGVIAVAATSVVVTHGLGFTPNLANIQISDTSSMAASSINSRWISAVSATTFTVTSNAAVAGVTFNFVWRASFNGT